MALAFHLDYLSAAGLASLSIALPASRSGLGPFPIPESGRLAFGNDLRLRQCIHRLPPFGLIASTALVFVIVPMWFMQLGLPSQGLGVDLVRSDLSLQTRALARGPHCADRCPQLVVSQRQADFSFGSAE